MTASRRLWPESLALLLLGIGDLVLTVLLLNRGLAIEANPLLAAYLAFGVQWFLVAKAVLLCLVPIGMVEWLRERYPARENRLRLIMRVGLAAYAVLYVMLVARVNL